MWNVTIVGFDPENPTAQKHLKVRGESLRTLSARCRAAALWTCNVSIKQVSDNYVEIAPSTRSGQIGVAKCTKVHVEKPKVLSKEERIYLELSGYDLRDVINFCIRRRAELKASADQPDTEAQPHD